MAIQKFRVTGHAHIRDDETGEDVAPGGVVALDDAFPGRDIAALISAGHLGPVEKAKPDKKTE